MKIVEAIGNWVKVDSEAIYAIRLVPTGIDVKFTTGGIYRYLGGTAADFDRLVASPSKGYHVNMYIKEFPFRRIRKNIRH